MTAHKLTTFLCTFNFSFLFRLFCFDVLRAQNMQKERERIRSKNSHFRKITRKGNIADTF